MKEERGKTEGKLEDPSNKRKLKTKDMQFLPNPLSKN